MVYHPLNDRIENEEKEGDRIGHWVSIVSMDEDYTYISNPMDNQIEKIETKLFIGSWVNFAKGGNNTVVLSSKSY